MSKRYLQWGYDSFKDTKTGEIIDDHIHLLNKQAERIAELEEQLKNAIRLPCKIDDIVYWVDYDNTIKQGKVFEISVHIDGILVHTGIRYCLETDKIFLTYEEAQAKLKELTAKNV